MSLLSLVLTVQPREAREMSSTQGRAAHAALLNAVKKVDPVLANEMHDETMPRAFTCSSLRGRRQDNKVMPEWTYSVRYTALSAPLANLLPTLFAPGTEIVLDEVSFVVVGATSDPAKEDWAARLTYEELSARWLLARETPASRIELRLYSPTAFKTAGKLQILPLPDLVFGSLLAKWNTFAPVALPEEARRFAAECLVVSRLQLRSHAAPFKDESAFKSGAVGSVTYAAATRDRYWLAVMNTLADFAQFAGLGVSTTMGMGQTRRMKAEGGRMKDEIGERKNGSADFVSG
jgi:CRISPR-associated endoribonuclease Cas6